MLPEALVLLLAVVWTVTGQTSTTQCVRRLQEEGAIKVDLRTPFNLSEANTACRAVGRFIMTNPYLLNDAERALCGDRPVPFDNMEVDVANCSAVKVASNQTLSVSNEFEYGCLLCQHDFANALTDGLEQFASREKYFKVYLLSGDTKESDQVTDEVKTALLEELFQQLYLWEKESIALHRAWLDDEQRLQIEFWISSASSVSLVNDNTEIRVLSDDYMMRIHDVSFCSGGETVGADETAIFWSAMWEGSTAFQRDPKTGVVVGRDCLFNFTAHRSEWDPQLTRWQINWGPCEEGEDVNTNERSWLPILSDEVKLRHANVLHRFTSAPVNTSTFQNEIADLFDRERDSRKEPNQQIIRDLIKITSDIKLDKDHIVTTNKSYSSLIVADIKGSEPFEGFTVEATEEEYSLFGQITLNRKTTLHGRAPFALDISATLVEGHTRMAFLLTFKTEVNTRQHTRTFKEDKSTQVTIMFPRPDEVSAWTFASYGNHHVDITYSDPKNSSNFIVLAWNDVLKEWVGDGCRTMYFQVNEFSASRCSAKYFYMQDGVPIANYALRKGMLGSYFYVYNNPFTDFFKDKIALMTATAIECLLSVLGLGSIICTAIFFKQWRENTGHKILLHMVFALTCNLVLGFTVNFVHMSVESLGCLIYGVLRHYSFLAMFLWMLVLSFLQLKRLLTVAGAKAITHLVLKVSVFAWGVPLVPITILLVISPGFYQGDRFDRGFCYPEGLVFHATVQGPAGLILFINLGIFIAIVLNIFECTGDEKITRHSKNERAEQLNKLKTSLFIFFLFGFSWVFHILSEERVIISDFLFEYLFLMTATFHIFVLSLFFVVFQENTRKDWITLINNVCKRS